MKHFYISLRIVAILSISWISISTSFAQTNFPKKIILLIGDGMGTEEVKAANMFQGAPLSFENMPYKGYATTHCYNKKITDSAASGTALATGRKTNYQTVAMDINGNNLTTVLEYHKQQGKSTGLVTTTFLTHATPASFASHQIKRNRYTQIAQDMLSIKPNVLMGGSKYIKRTNAISAGYRVAYTIPEFKKPIQIDQNPHYAVLWPTNNHMPYEADYANRTYPYAHLSDMAIKAVEILNQDPDGFFLMVEGGKIDHAGHQNNIKRNVYETIEFSNTVAKILAWAKTEEDVLILVTADHETGSLLVKKDNGKGKLPTVVWGTGGHSFLPVGVYGYGEQAKSIHNKVIDNIDICHLMIPTPPLNPSLDSQKRPKLTCSQWALAGGYTFISSPSTQRINLNISPSSAVDHRETSPIGEKIYWSKAYRGAVSVTQINPSPQITQNIQIYGQPNTPKKPSYTPYPYAGRESTLNSKHTLGATNYTWTITPEEAYESIQPLFNEAKVIWNENFSGSIKIEVQAVNHWQTQPTKAQRNTFVRLSYPLHLKVMSQNNHLPIEGAKINVANENFITDYQGKAEIEHCISGDQIPLTVHSEDYLDLQKNISVNQEKTIEIELTSLSTSTNLKATQEPFLTTQGSTIELHQVDKIKRIEVINLYGSVLQTILNPNQDQRIRCQSIPSGVYIIRLYREEGAKPILLKTTL
ncbi:alkaline phosphatase [Halosquirtibacter xylanolyticus]|uniref:alkaline phosphatase n=1 Tax=Halosquirtibacter xylanolyticus TaxID=3374599 RepID=UPI003749DEE0|nr:alkaline phosphatase [Prolixibacteraceae bacterium]